jgi:hypothetical protein
MPQTPEEVGTTVRALAQALRSEGRGIIAGDDGVFDRMKGVFFWNV